MRRNPDCSETTLRPRVATSVVLVLGIALAVATASGSLVACGSTTSDGLPPDDVPPVVVAEADGLRYEFHVFTGREFLWRVGASDEDRRNLLREHADAARRLRRTCESRLRIDSLDVLHAPHREAAEALHGLGYL